MGIGGSREAPSAAAANTSPGSWRARTWTPTRCAWCRATTIPGCSRRRLEADDASWVAGPRRRRPARYAAKTRYRQGDAPCRWSGRRAGAFHLEFSEPQWAVTPGQSAVLYSGEVCLGGGVIAAQAG